MSPIHALSLFVLFVPFVADLLFHVSASQRARQLNCPSVPNGLGQAKLLILLTFYTSVPLSHRFFSVKTQSLSLPVLTSVPLSHRFFFNFPFSIFNYQLALSHCPTTFFSACRIALRSGLPDREHPSAEEAVPPIFRGTASKKMWGQLPVRQA